MTAEGLVLVSGATGFLGRHVCRRLLDSGWRVRGLARAGGGGLTPGVEPSPITDLLDANGIQRAVIGVGAVVHCAARVHRSREDGPGSANEYRRVNVDGTRSLLDAAVRAGASKFVLVSSVKAVADFSARPLTEDAPGRPSDAYGASKLEAERLVRDAADKRRMHAPILRLPLAYGPGMGGNMLRLFRAVDAGFPLPLGGAVGRRSLVYAGNVAAAVHAVLEAPAAGRETFFVSDGFSPSVAELVREISTVLGKPSRNVTIPAGVLKTIGRAGDVLAPLIPVPFRSEDMDRLLNPLMIDSSKLRRVVGFAPPFSFDEGLRLTAEWYMRTGGRRA